MLVQSVGVQNNSVQNRPLRRNNNQNVAFKRIVVEVARDSQDVKVIDSVNQFFGFMKKLATKAISGDSKANTKLRALIGEKSASALSLNPGVFTVKADATTKLIPMSGEGSRGKAIRQKITDTLGMEPTNKAIMPLPAVLGDHQGKPVYLSTVNNEFLHMMEAGVMSPFENIHVIKSHTSDGDLAVAVKGLEKGAVPKDKPAILTYTDDIGDHGARDYSNLVAKYKSRPTDSETKVIAVGFQETKANAAGKLGCFLPDGGAFRVFEKPSVETLDTHLPGDQKVLTNIGKILLTPKGLADIEKRSKENPLSLTKVDKIVDGKEIRKLHVTEGVMKPAGAEGTLDVIPKDGQFSDVGNGAVFTDKMLDIAEGRMPNIFAESLESQIRKNVKAAPDGKSATLDYNGTKVELPTSKAEQ